MNRFCQVLLTAAIIFISNGASRAQYSGSQAYNQFQHMAASVNTATGTFHMSYPLLKTSGIHNPFTLKLSYRFNANGTFGLPRGWQLGLDHVNKNVVEIGGQWLIDPLWHDETLFASGLKYANQHGSQFQDKIEEELVPGEDSLYYRYRSQHKDGVIKYFSYQGLLILQKDRFGNKITFEYEQPVGNIATTKLMAVIDNYGNRYTFSYTPGSLTVQYPDARQQRLFFNEKGVTAIVNPHQQRFDIEYTHYNGQNLIKTLSSPSGLISQLSYGTIPFKNEQGEGTLPVVITYQQSDAADKKIHTEMHYGYTEENNYTGYPSYFMSQSHDGLMESNDENYRYKVKVEKIDNSQAIPQIHHKVYYYNYLHLPVEIRTYKNGKEFLKTNLTYAISPFKYSRSTNYDKPASVVHYVWSETAGEHVPSNRVDHRYDLFGNKTHESYWFYDRPKQSWLQLKAEEYKYYTAAYSLLAESVHKDLVSGMAFKEEYHLSPSKKTHRFKRTFGMKSGQTNAWQPWQQQSYCYDHLGRVVFGELKWLAKGMPGVQHTHKKTHYLFDKNTGVLTTQHVSSLGRVTQYLMDTRNHRIKTQISAKGEQVNYRYDALNRIIETIDPEGYRHKKHYYSYGQDGFNAMVIESPLGFKKRYTIDASSRPLVAEEWIDGKYRKLGTKEFNAFGKVITSKNKYGHETTYKYDDQMRLIEQIDPWLNKKQFVYDDEKRVSYSLINGKKHKQEEKTPWSLTMKQTYFPLRNDKLEAIEIITKKDPFGRELSQESALLNTQFSTRHAVIKNRYEYDIGHNRKKIITQGYDGLSLTKEIKYDLFRNQYSTVKKQNDNGRVNTHVGYSYLFNSDNKLERVISPEFDHNKRLITQHRYDKNGREIEREFADGNIVRHQYTPRGFLKSFSWQRNDKTFQVNHEYNADGWLTKASDSDGQELHYQYNLKGKLTRRIYPDKQQQDYEYDQYNRLVRQKNVGNRLLTYHYDDKDKGLLSAIKSDAHQVRFTYGINDNGAQGSLLAVERDIVGTGKTKETFTYGPYGRMIASSVTTVDSSNDDASQGAGKKLLSREYEFLPRGELVKQTTRSVNADNQPVSDSISYRYDMLKRLTQETHTQTANNQPVNAAHKEISYQYDGNNNLLKEKRTEGGATQTIHRYYNEADQLTTIKKETPAKALTIEHDQDGKIVVDHQGHRYHYDGKGILLSVSDPKGKTLVRFFYWPDGLLAHTSDGSMSQSFYYHTNGQVQTVDKNKKRHDYIRYGNRFLGTLKGDGGEHLFTSNRSTGARLRVDEKGKQAVDLFKYEGYGQSQSPVDEDSGSSADFLWNQEFRDDKTGLVYLRHRFYHPELRRFVKRDDQNIDNLYAYAAANPVQFIDPLGHHASHSDGLFGMNLGLGIVFTLLTTTIAILGAVETGGTSLSLTSIFGLLGAGAGAMSSVATIGSQVAFDLGDQRAGSGLRYFSYGMAGISGLYGIAGVASFIAHGLSESAVEFIGETENIALKPVSKLDTAAAEPPINRAEPFLKAGENGIKAIPGESYDLSMLADSEVYLKGGKAYRMDSNFADSGRLPNLRPEEMNDFAKAGFHFSNSKCQDMAVITDSGELYRILPPGAAQNDELNNSVSNIAYNNSAENSMDGFTNDAASNNLMTDHSVNQGGGVMNTPGAPDPLRHAGQIANDSSNVNAQHSVLNSSVNSSAGFW